MNNIELNSLVEDLRTAAERLNCELDVEINPPASHEAIANVAIALGDTLPDSLVSFLLMHDGMRLYLNAKTPTADDALLYPLLHIYGTEAISLFKKSIPGMFDAGELSKSTRDKALRCVPIASVNPYDQAHIMFVRDDPQRNNEYAIIEAVFDNQQIWLDPLDKDIEIMTIARSFEEFVRRAIGNVLSKKYGFRYWNAKAACVKYRGSSPDADESLF